MCFVIIAVVLAVHGRPAGKTSSSPHLNDIRLILPQSAFLTILDIIYADRLNRLVDEKLKRRLGPQVFVGARSGTQPLDIAHTLQLVLDKSLDLESQGTLGQI